MGSNPGVSLSPFFLILYFLKMNIKEKNMLRKTMYFQCSDISFSISHIFLLDKDKKKTSKSG